MHLTTEPTPGHKAAKSADVLFLPHARKDSRERDVERINLFTHYELGKKLQSISAMFNAESTPATAAFFPLFAARNALRELLDGPIPLGLSRSSTAKLHDAVEILINHHFSAEDESGQKKFRFPDDTTEPVMSWDWSWIKSALDKFETVFAKLIGAEPHPSE